MAAADTQLRTATLQGLVAVFLWASLASMTVAVAAIPPLQRLAITFAIATVSCWIYFVLKGERPLRDNAGVPAWYWGLGLYGLLGYHAAYFFALSGPAPLQANLVNYLWPLLITLLSIALMRKQRARASKLMIITGAFAGFAGTMIAIGPTDADKLPAGALPTLIAAFVAALIWSTYSVSLDRFRAVPSSAVTVLCGLSALGALALHMIFETACWDLDAKAIAILIAQGIGPAGLAFTFWDAAMKHGNVALLGVVSYGIPLLSTALLVVSGQAQATPALWAGALLVAGGAALATSASRIDPRSKNN